MEMYVLPMLTESEMTENIHFSLPCTIYSIFVLIDLNASETGDLGESITKVGLELMSFGLMNGICPMIGSLVIFSMSFFSRILVLSISLRKINRAGIAQPRNSKKYCLKTKIMPFNKNVQKNNTRNSAN